jgi:hypothetical protein
MAQLTINHAGGRITKDIRTEEELELLIAFLRDYCKVTDLELKHLEDDELREYYQEEEPEPMDSWIPITNG